MKNFIIFINICIVMVVATIVLQTEEPVIEIRNPAVTPTATVSASLVDLKASYPSTPSTYAEAMPVKDSLKENKTSALSKKDEEFIRAFIHESSESRIMDREEGKLASQRGTSRALKDYGTMMIDDQTRMLRELNQIAESKNIEIASALGKDKTEGLSDLHKVHGRRFDAKFIRMMIIDHKRDVRKFEKATTSADPDVQVFATKYLPVIKGHLEKIQSIKKEQVK